MTAAPSAPAVRSPLVGRSLALTAAVCFGANGTISKLVLQAGMPADRLTALRTGGAAIGLLLVVAATKPWTLRVRREEVPLLLLCGLAGAALVQWLYFISIARLPVSVALLIEFTAPVLVALWARFGLPLSNRRRVHPRVWPAPAGRGRGCGIPGGLLRPCRTGCRRRGARDP
jgi:drug/metabolite transporter (DMT)-like permease